MAATTDATTSPVHSRTSSSPLGALLNARPHLVDSIAGACAGVASSLVTNPLEVVKIRRQNLRVGSAAATQPAPGTFTALKQLAQTEGLRGLYRGFPQTMLGYLPTWSIYFTAYETAKDWFARTLEKPSNSPVVHVLSAASAGAFNTSLTNPLWVVRTRFMTQSSSGATPYHYSSTWDAFKTIFQTEGVRAFYKGLGASLLGVSHVIVMFPLYEALRTGLANMSGRGERGKEPVTSVLIASIVSKMVAGGVTYPHEVLRTRLHTHVVPTNIPNGGATPPPNVRFDTLAVYGISPRYESSIGLPHEAPVSLSPPHTVVEKLSIPIEPGPPSQPTNLSTHAHSHPPERLTIRGLASEILHKEGGRGFYKGFGTNLLKTVPATAATMLTYEVTKKWLDRVRLEG